MKLSDYATFFFILLGSLATYWLLDLKASPNSGISVAIFAAMATTIRAVRQVATPKGQSNHD